jgi:hypothetical protein
MAKSKALTSSNEMKTYTSIVMSTAVHIENIYNKKNLPIRPNKSLMKMAENTTGLPARIAKSLDMVQAGSGFCCGGNDGYIFD